MLSILWPEWLIRAKNWLKKREYDLSLAAGVFLVVLFVYFASQALLLSRENPEVVIEGDAGAEEIKSRLPANLADLALPVEEASNQSSLRSDGTGQGSGIAEQERQGKFVASKNGKYYYWPESSWASRIKPENRVWFNTEEEAEVRSYKKSSDFYRSR